MQWLEDIAIYYLQKSIGNCNNPRQKIKKCSKLFRKKFRNFLWNKEVHGKTGKFKSKWRNQTNKTRLDLHFCVFMQEYFYRELYKLNQNDWMSQGNWIRFPIWGFRWNFDVSFLCFSSLSMFCFSTKKSGLWLYIQVGLVCLLKQDVILKTCQTLALKKVHTTFLKCK